MNVYMVFTKCFYTSKEVEYQMADALEPVIVYSSYAKANKAFEDEVKWYKERLNYEGEDSKHRNLFPVEHVSLKKTLSEVTFRVVIYIIKSEVE